MSIAPLLLETNAIGSERLEPSAKVFDRSARPFGMKFLEQLPLALSGTGTETPPPINLTGTPNNDIDHEPGEPDTDED
jgi:hypothetical protein